MVGRGVLEQLYFVELVSAYHAAFLGAVAACFSTEACAVTEVLFGQILFVQYLVAEKVDKGGFCRRQHKLATFAVGNLVDVVLELGELSCRKSAFVVEHVWRQHKCVAFGKVTVDKVVE